MSTQYDNNLKGALFRNENMREGKQDPEYRGNAEIDGVQYWVDAWLNESREGKKYMALKFRPKQAQDYRSGARPSGGGRSNQQRPAQQRSAERQQPAATQSAQRDDFDDDIPF